MKRRIKRYKRRKRTLFWCFIIVLCCIVLSALTVSSTALVEKFYRFMDASYQQADTLTKAYEKVKTITSR